MNPPEPTPTHEAPEQQRFEQLQSELLEQYRQYFPDPLAPKTVIIIPSLTLDPEILATIEGHNYYEERLLCMLMLLRMPRTQVVYVSSMPIDAAIVDYYLHLLPGITGFHARRRLTLLSCYDASSRSLTEKILARPRLVRRIRESIAPGHAAHVTFFNVTMHEQALALQLGIPLYGCPPSLSFWGTKSGSRQLFRRAGVCLPPGYENLRDMGEVRRALQALKQEHPRLRKAVVKLNDGFSGDGNALFAYPPGGALGEDHLRTGLRFVAQGMDYELFSAKMLQMGGIVEAFVEGEEKRSPSVQCRINPERGVEIISTHDQVLGGPAAQTYEGALFPAHPDYRVEIGETGRRIADELCALGALGRFGVDFVSVREGAGWKHYAIEINLRKGGTTHPYLMLQFLTGGTYNAARGLYEMPNGQTRSYFATDNLRREAYRTLTPEDLIDIAICRGLHFDGTVQEGVMFHLMGALPEFGKLGLLCVASDPARAQALYARAVALLDEETAPG